MNVGIFFIEKEIHKANDCYKEDEYLITRLIRELDDVDNKVIIKPKIKNECSLMSLKLLSLTKPQIVNFCKKANLNVNIMDNKNKLIEALLNSDKELLTNIMVEFENSRSLEFKLSKLTKHQLKRLCEKGNIKCNPSDKKDKRIELLMESYDQTELLLKTIKWL